MSVFTFTKLWRVMLLAAVVVVWLLGCGNNSGSSGSSSGKSSDLVAHWLYLGGSMNGPRKSMELFKDGTGVSDGGTITWKIENKRFIIQSATKGVACDYKVSGSRLTLTYDDNSSAIFVNKNTFKMEHSASSITDNRDGKKYKTVKISGRNWMAENLNYQPNSGSWCYDNNNSNCDKYGRLYDWSTAKSVCLSGWHLPSFEEWDELEGLVKFADGGDAGTKLKSTSGWDGNGNGTDDFGFSGLPGGNRRPNGEFVYIGRYGNWWTTKKNSNGEAYRRNLASDEYGVGVFSGDTSYSFSVRCVQN